MGDLKSRFREYLAPVLGGALLFAVLGVWAWHEHTRVRVQALNEMRQSGDAVGRALVGSMRPQMRRGRSRRQRFVETLESVVETTGIRFVVVLLEGNTIAAAGEVPAELETTGDTDERLAGNTFILWRTVRIQGPPYVRGGFRRGPALETDGLTDVGEEEWFQGRGRDR